MQCNGQEMPIDSLPTLEDLSAKFDSMGNIVHILNSREREVCGYRRFRFPLNFQFNDRHNRQWIITIENRYDNITLMIPCAAELLWFADEKSGRIAMNAATTLVQLSVSYKTPFYYPHGVRVQLIGYMFENTSRFKFEKAKWNEILELASKGVGIATNVATTALRFMH